jgi:nitrogen regulatory protein PII
MTPTESDVVELVQLEAIVRLQVLDRVIHHLREAGAGRLTVLRAHSIGTGADPVAARHSVEEGSAYADAGLVRVVCLAAQAPIFRRSILEAARTGRRGDGIIVESRVQHVVKIRSGVEGLDALA